MGKYFLFAGPSLIEGMGRLVDFGGTLNEYNTSPSDEIADARALSSDWRAVAEDLRNAVDALNVESENGRPSNS